MRQRANLTVVPDPTPAPPAWDADLIPQLPKSKKPQEYQDLDMVMQGFSLEDAYLRYSGKQMPALKGKTEEKLSCPVPGHVDNNPSASFNFTDQRWICHACNIGGDKFVLVALNRGFDHVAITQKGNTDFHKLKRMIAEDLGYQIFKDDATGKVLAVPPKVEGDGDAKVMELALPGAFPDPNAQMKVPPIVWENIAEKETFLDIFLNMACVDAQPEAFYFWEGLMTLGLAVGWDVVLRDQPSVKPILFLLLVGPTGSGKSRTLRLVDEVLYGACKYDHNNPKSKGVMRLGQPGSAEALVDNFSRPIQDLNTHQITGYGNVRGLLKIDELSSLMGRSARVGSTLKPQLMELYDAPDEIELRSRGAGVVHAEKPFCAMVTTTQPEVMQRLLSSDDIDSGFMNRIIPCIGEHKKMSAFTDINYNTGPSIDALKKIHTWSMTGHVITLTDEAKADFEEFFQERIVPHKLGNSPMMARIDLTMKKIMLLLAINEMSDVVTDVMVEKTIQLYPYLLAVYGQTERRMAVSQSDECGNRVLQFISDFTQKNKKYPTMRDIVRVCVTKTNDRAAVQKAMEMLQKSGFVEEEMILTTAKGGRPTKRYLIANE